MYCISLWVFIYSYYGKLDAHSWREIKTEHKNLNEGWHLFFGLLSKSRSNIIHYVKDMDIKQQLLITFAEPDVIQIICIKKELTMHGKSVANAAFIFKTCFFMLAHMRLICFLLQQQFFSGLKCVQSFLFCSSKARKAHNQTGIGLSLFHKIYCWSKIFNALLPSVYPMLKMNAWKISKIMKGVKLVTDESSVTYRGQYQIHLK